MKDIGEQVRELLPEYPHLWSRVIAAIERARADALDDAIDLVDDELFSQSAQLRREPAGNNHLWSAYSGAVDSLTPLLDEIRALKKAGEK